MGNDVFNSQIWAFRITFYPFELSLSPIFGRSSIMLPLLLIRTIRKELFWSLKKANIILLGMFNGIAYTFQFTGQVWTTAGVATILINTYVLFTPIFAHFLLKKKISRKKKIAVVTGFVGVIIIALGDILDFSAKGVSIYGILLVLSAGIFAGLYVSFSEKVYFLKYNERSLNPVTIFFASTIYSCLVIALIGLMLDDLPDFTNLQFRSLIPVFYLGIFCTSGAFILYLLTVRAIGSVNSAVFMLLQIIISFCFSFLLLKEIPDGFIYLGSSLIFVAIYLTRNM